MDSNEIKGSILRLRELREELCQKQRNWKEAFVARDYVVAQIHELHDMIVDRRIRRKKLEDKSSHILDCLSEFSEGTKQRNDGDS